MIKTKDGYVKLIGTIYLGNPNYLLKADGDAWAVHTNVNNEANKIVRTDDNGFLLTGLINTTSSNIGTSIINRIYCSNDGYIRYKTPEDFFSMLDNDENLISITVGSLNRKLTVDYANNATRLYLVNCYNGTTNNDLWSTIKTSNSYYKGTATIYEVYNDGGPTTYGEVLDIVSVHSSHWLPLLWLGSGKTGSIYYRNKDYNDDTWGNWRQLAFITDNVASSTTVKVSQHTTNNTNYPLVWANEPNTSSVNSDLYKSWSHLYYNPATRKLTSVGGINAGNSLLTTGTGDIYLEWYRGTNASWRILNTSGTLKFQCNYTTGVSTYYDVLNLSYNTGNASLKGDFTLGGLILRIGKGSSWVKGRDYAVIRMNTSSGYSPIWSAKTTNGSWDCGTYTENRLHFSYITDSNYNSNTNTQSANIYFNPNGLIGVNGIISTSTVRIKCTTGNYQEGLTIQNADSTWCTIRLGNTADSGTTENTWSIHRTSSNNFSISRNSSNGANGLTINKSGNVGIGYADSAIPGYKLAVNGTLYTTGNHYYLFNGDSTLRIYGETSGNSEGINLLVGIDGRFDNYTISSYGGESRHPLILNPRGGYVGIGIRPSHKLHVNGNTYTTGYVSGNTLTSRVATGTAPLTVTSTTKVNNLNADLLDGYHGGINGFYRTYYKLYESSYNKYVIPLIDLTNPTSNTSQESTAIGKITFARINALYSSTSIYFNIQRRYNSNAFNGSYYINGGSSWVKLCTFTYKGKKWAGVWYYPGDAQAVARVSLDECTIGQVTNIAYYNTQTGVLNSEINNSLVFTDGECSRALYGISESAAKLQTARIIWGQPFNGTANIVGNLTLGGGYSIIGRNNISILKDYNNNNVTLSAAKGDLYIGYDYTNNIRFYSGNSNGTGTLKMILLANGNLGIGTGSPSEKLYVNGNTYITGILTTYTNGTGNYNQGIRINRTALSNWATLTIGYVGSGTTGTSANTWLIGTPGNSNSLIFNLNGASTSAGLCLKGHGNTDMKWNNNTIWHEGNDGHRSGLDADKLDGKHASSFYENGYVLFGYTINASSLNQNTYYPVTFSIGAHHNVRIECRVSLNSLTKPSWSTHKGGFSTRKIWEVNGSGWGTNPVNRIILVSDYAFATADPVRGVGQLTNSSVEYVYVRGGGKYYFYTSHNISPVLRTSTYTTNSQSVSPTTSAPAAISRNVAYTSEFVTSLGTNGNYLTWTRNGSTYNITIPYATNADKLDGFHANTSLNPFGKIPTIGSDGVMEVGRYLDFHYNSSDTSDYRTRLWINHSSGSYTATLPAKSGTLAMTSDIPTVTNYYWANIRVSSSSSTRTSPTFSTAYTSNWFRSNGQTGWYSLTYGGGIYMTDTTYVRVYNGKRFYASGGYLAPYTGSSWISMATRTNCIVADLNNSASSAHALFRVKNSSGHAIAFGGLGASIGFYGFYASRISAGSNGYDWATTWNAGTGVITHSKTIYTAGYYHSSVNSNNYVLLAGGSYKNLADFAKGNAGASNRGVYVTSGTVKAMTYYLNATINSGSSGKLAYYSGTNSIDDYVSNKGSAAVPIYLFRGEPTPCAGSFLGKYTLPIVLFAGSISRSVNSTSWYISAQCKHYSIASAHVSISGGVMTLSFTPNSGYAIYCYGATCHMSTSADMPNYLGSYDGRDNGANWYGCYCTSSNRVYIRTMYQRDLNNGSWGSKGWNYGDSETRVNVVVFGYAN